MTLYRDMTTPQLAQHGLHWKTTSPHEHRMIYALAKRLEQEYKRANMHCVKLTEAATTIHRQTEQLGHLEHCLNTNRPGPGYVKVAKPHIQRVFTEPGNKGLWRCTGSFGTVQYGPGPGEAYAAWRHVMERGQGIPRKGK